MNETLIYVTHTYLVSVDCVSGTPIEDADWVLIVSHYISMRSFYFIAGLGNVILVVVGKMFVFSLYYNFIWKILYT